MPARPRHPDKHLEALIKSLEEQGWTATKGSKYFKMKCPCTDEHKTIIHMTPRRHYINHKRTHLAHYSCWEEDGAK